MAVTAAVHGGFSDRFSAVRTTGLFSIEIKEGQLQLLLANPAFRTHFDLPAMGGEGKLITQYIAGETGADLERCITEAVTKNRIMTRRICVKRGEEATWYLLELSPDPEDQRYLHGSSVDVTQNTKSDNALNSVEGFDRYITHATDHTPEPVLISDVMSEGIPVVHMNNAFSRIFGYSRYELLGRDPIHLLFSGQANDVTDMIEKAWRGGKAVWGRFPAVTKMGEVIQSDVVFDFFKRERGEIYLLKITFLHLREPGTSPLTELKHKRVQISGFQNAAKSIINDFNNLLAVVLGSNNLFSVPLSEIQQSVARSKEYATAAANELLHVLGTPASGSAKIPEPVLPGGDVAPDHNSGAGMRVLVVDDEPFIRNMIVQCLSFVGYQTISVPTGEEALDYIEKLNPATPLACIVMDYTLSGVSGLEVLQALRINSVQIPVVMVSGYFGEEVQQQAEALGRTLLLSKPFQPDDLLTAVETLTHL